MSEGNFEIRIVNGLQGDPAVFALIRRLGEGILFDLGSLETLTHKDLLKVRNVFVSHAHMDHFIGFDRLLRVNVPHKRLIRIWGPAPFIDRVQAKLRAYTWNLIDADQIRFQVSEIFSDGHIEEALLSNSDHFEIRRSTSSQTLKEICSFEDGSQVSASFLDHKGTPSIAYKIAAPPFFRVHTEALKELGIKPGPWLSQLQSKMRRGNGDESIEIEGKLYSVKDLGEQLITIEASHSVAYLTDFSFDSDNLQRLKSDLGKSLHVISECSFLDADVDRAVDKAHLTSRQSSLLAAALEATELFSFHVSGIYGQFPQQVADEAQKIFQDLRQMEKKQLDEALNAELLRVDFLKKGLSARTS